MFVFQLVVNGKKSWKSYVHYLMHKPRPGTLHFQPNPVREILVKKPGLDYLMMK